MPTSNALTSCLCKQKDLLFSVLIGSRANGSAHEKSDWDIAVQWEYAPDWMQTLSCHETLRQNLAQALNTSESQIDLIDLQDASLAMRANVAENGKILSGENSLAWAHFLTRTWRELEDYYWEKDHAS